MRYPAVLPILIICLVIVQADLNDILTVHDLHIDKVIEYENPADFSISQADAEYNEELIGSNEIQGEHERPLMEWTDSSIRSSNHQRSKASGRTSTSISARSENSRPIQKSIARQSNSISSQSSTQNLSAWIHIRNDKLQENRIVLRKRGSPRDGSVGRALQDARSTSPPPLQPRISTSANQEQQQTSTGRRRVHMLQPLTLETLSQIGSTHENLAPGNSGRTAVGSDGSSPRHQQQRQRSSPNRSILSPSGILLAEDHSRHGARSFAGQATSLDKSSSTSSLSDSLSARLDSMDRELEAESRSTHQGNGSGATSPSQTYTRRREREGPNQLSASITNSRRSTAEQASQRFTDDPTSPSLSGNGPVTRRRRLQRRSSISNIQRQDHLHTVSEPSLQANGRVLTIRSITDFPVLIRRGGKKNKGKSGGSRPRSSRPSSASSSASSLQTSKSGAKSSEGAQKQQKGLKSSTSTESIGQSAGSSRPQAQNPQNSGQTASPFKTYAFMYGKKNPRKQNKESSSSQADTSPKVPPIRTARAGSGGELSPSSPAVSFKSVTSRTSSSDSLNSFFSANSGELVSPVGSPRSNRAASPASRNGSVGSPHNLTPPESPRSSIAQSQARQSLSLSKPPSPFADIRSQESQSVPSPSTHRRPSPFANAHLRAYSAPDLIFHNHATSSPLSPKSSTASIQAKISSSLPQPGSSRPGSPPLNAPRPEPLLNTPASAISWKTQQSMPRQNSVSSVSSPTLSDSLRAAAPSLIQSWNQAPPSQRLSDQGPSNQRPSNILPSSREPSSSIYPSPPRNQMIPGSPPTPLTQEPLPLYHEAERHLDPVIARPSGRFGPVGSPVRGSPMFSSSYKLPPKS